MLPNVTPEQIAIISSGLGLSANPFVERRSPDTPKISEIPVPFNSVLRLNTR